MGLSAKQKNKRAPKYLNLLKEIYPNNGGGEFISFIDIDKAIKKFKISETIRSSLVPVGILGKVGRGLYAWMASKPDIKMAKKLHKHKYERTLKYKKTEMSNRKEKKPQIISEWGYIDRKEFATTIKPKTKPVREKLIKNPLGTNVSFMEIKIFGLPVFSYKKSK